MAAWGTMQRSLKAGWSIRHRFLRGRLCRCTLFEKRTEKLEKKWWRLLKLAEQTNFQWWPKTFKIQSITKREKTLCIISTTTVNCSMTNAPCIIFSWIITSQEPQIVINRILMLLFEFKLQCLMFWKKELNVKRSCFLNFFFLFFGGGGRGELWVVYLESKNNILHS